MKGKLNVLLAGVAMITMTACSSTKTYVESTSYKVPNGMMIVNNILLTNGTNCSGVKRTQQVAEPQLMGLKTFQEAQQL